MSARIAVRNAKRRRRIITASWVLGLTILVGVLIIWELTAVLYVLATLGVTALLLVVAMSDISHAEQSSSPGTLPAQPLTNTSLGVGKSDWGANKRS